MTTRVPRVRRAPHLVSYWRDGALTIRNYATGETARVSPLVFLILDFAGTWRTGDEIADAIPIAGRAAVTRAVRRLVGRTLLERSDRPRDPRVARMHTFDPWNPEAGFFHTATRRVRFWTTRQARRHARETLAHTPMPRPAKRYPKAPRVVLPAPERDAEWPSVLLSRRTWRRYATSSVTLEELGAILGLAAGVQEWARGMGGEAALKTSPSGGARHPIECYVVARNVGGLRPGIYHYASARHELERIHGAVTPSRMKTYVPESSYFAKAPVMVFFTAMFERQLWRYPYSRAYRAALIEAGHVCQTFLLAATWLGLAPFSVMGLADEVIEQDLGIDGITEAVLYAGGFGRRPRGATRASMPRGSLTTRPNARLR